MRTEVYRSAGAVAPENLVGCVNLPELFLCLRVETGVVSESIRVPDLRHVTVGALDVFSCGAGSQPKDFQRLFDIHGSWPYWAGPYLGKKPNVLQAISVGNGRI